jgi:hypothetical protein
MDEKQFRDTLHELLKDRLLGYNVVKGGSLLYKLMIDSQGKLQPEPETLADPKRGQLAFQTDIVVKNEIVPLVVLELKVGDFSTHDVLIYSSKAAKHKEVYPYLRYGFVIGEKTKIEKRVKNVARSAFARSTYQPRQLGHFQPNQHRGSILGYLEHFRRPVVQSTCHSRRLFCCRQRLLESSLRLCHPRSSCSMCQFRFGLGSRRRLSCNCHRQAPWCPI